MYPDLTNTDCERVISIWVVLGEGKLTYHNHESGVSIDAPYLIGSGHVMRCLTLADYLKNAGHQTFFICREHEGIFRSIRETRTTRPRVVGQSRKIENAKISTANTLMLGVAGSRMPKRRLLLCEVPFLVRTGWCDHYALTRPGKTRFPFVSHLFN